MNMSDFLLRSFLLESKISTFLKEENVSLPPNKVMENPNFRKWFGNSVTVNSDGTPMVFYHGTKHVFDTFDATAIASSTKDYGWYGIGFYFTPDSSYADVYSDSDRGFRPNMGNPNILPVYLSIKKPFYGDKTGDLNNYLKVNGLPKQPYAIDKDWLLSYLKDNDEEDYQALATYLDVGADKYYNLENISSPLINFINKYGLFDASGERPMLDKWVEEFKKLLKTNNPKFVMKPIQWKIGDVSQLTDYGKKNLTTIFTENIKKMGYDGVITKDEYLVFEPNQIKSIYNNGQFSVTSNNISEDLIYE